MRAIVLMLLTFWGVLSIVALETRCQDDTVPASRTGIVGLVHLKPEGESLITLEGGKQKEYPIARGLKVVSQGLGRCALVHRLGLFHVQKGMERLVTRVSHEEFRYEDLPRPRVLPGRLAFGQVQVYPPILYFCKIAAVNVQQRHLTAVLDPVQQQKMSSVLSEEFDQFARLEIQLSLSPKATAERNFERVTLANLAGVEKAVIWLDQEGQVFHVDAFLYDLFWLRTGIDRKQQVLQNLHRSVDHLDRVEVVDTLPLSKDVRVYTVRNVHREDVPRDRPILPIQSIPLEDFPGDSWEVPTSTWIQLNEPQKEVKCVIVLPVWE